MTAATLTTGNERVTLIPATIDTFVHQPWCAEHWDADDTVCWATDVEVQVRDAAGDDNHGCITVVMTHGTRPGPHTGAEAPKLTLFIGTVRDGEGSVEFTPDEAEIAAHGLLAMVMRSRGFTSAADWHETTAQRMAAELLASREAGAK